MVLLCNNSGHCTREPTKTLGNLPSLTLSACAQPKKHLANNGKGVLTCFLHFDHLSSERLEELLPMKKYPDGIYSHCPHSVDVPFGKCVLVNNQGHFSCSLSWHRDTQLWEAAQHRGPLGLNTVMDSSPGSTCQEGSCDNSVSFLRTLW